MKPLELKDFLQYRYLSGLTWAPGGGAAAFLVKEANLDKNGYDTHIWIHRGGKQTQLTAAGDETGLCWEDGKHILFPDLRTDADKKRRADGEQFTVFYRIGIDGGEALRAFELPFAVTELAVADENYFVAMGKIDVNCPDYYAMTDQARRETEKYWKEESDFQVIDELPFRFNGMGYINKVRNAIFLVNRKTLEVRRLSAANEEVNAWTMVDGKVCYCAEAIETKMLYRQKIYVCDPAQGEAVCKYGGAEYQIEYMVGYKGKVVFAGGTQERYGSTRTPCSTRWTWTPERSPSSPTTPTPSIPPSAATAAWAAPVWPRSAATRSTTWPPSATRCGS